MEKEKETKKTPAKEVKETPWEVLSKINVNEHTEKKGNLTYLSWAWAWSIVKTYYPKSYSKVYENKEGWNYHSDGKTAWVKCGFVLVDGDSADEIIEYLPVMDYKNQSVKVENITSMQVNTAIQRCITKAIARHGLGAYIYAGEDIPKEEQEQQIEQEKKAKKEQAMTLREIVQKALKEHPDKYEMCVQKYGAFELHTLTDEQVQNIYLAFKNNGLI